MHSDRKCTPLKSSHTEISRIAPSLFLLMIRRPPRSTLFPYTTLFRSHLRRPTPGTILGSLALIVALAGNANALRSEVHTSEIQSHRNISYCAFSFFVNDTATPEIYPLSLHDALPISPSSPHARDDPRFTRLDRGIGRERECT